MKNRLDKNEENEKSEDEKRQKQRKINDQLLVEAIDIINKHVQDSKIMMQEKNCD